MLQVLELKVDLQVFSQIKAHSQLHAAQQHNNVHTSTLHSHTETYCLLRLSNTSKWQNAANKAHSIPKSKGALGITPVPGVGLLIVLVQTLPLAENWSTAFSNKIQDPEN